MTLDSRNAARLFALTFFAILTLMLAVTVLVAMNCRDWREIAHVEDVQSEQQKDIEGLKPQIDWAHRAVQEMRDEVEKLINVKHKAGK